MNKSTRTTARQYRRQSLPAKPELVLGAGGIKGYGHIGVLKALIAAGIELSIVTGVSVGSIIAAFFTNGYTPERILEIFEDAIEKRTNFGLMLKCLSSIPDPVSLMVGGWMDLNPAVREMVEEFHLKPNPRLRIVACDLFKHLPVSFEWPEGTEFAEFDTDKEAYDALAHAITSSCSLPGVFRSQWHRSDHGMQLLGDGAIYHYNPTDFCQDAAIVVVCKQATEMPSSFGSWFDWYFSAREIYLPMAGNHRYVDPDKHLVVEIGLSDVAGLNFGIPRGKRLDLVDNGQSTMRDAIASARAEGRLCNTH